MNKAIMRRINNDGIKKGYNRLICEDFLENLPDVNFPIVDSFLHEQFPEFMGQTAKQVMRCIVAINEKGQILVLDMSEDQYNFLPVR